MNKVKKFEISVVDRTYSKVISDVVKFYSSDSALEVIFILAEEVYEFDSAELVLSNTDGSLITRPLTKSPEGYSYEIEKNVISHHGEWKGQVILTSGSDTYVSSKIRFTIENDLLGEQPPKLTDVYSWTSLKRYADGLVDELKQAVLSVEGIEDTFNANETVRQRQFDNAEQSRQENETTRQQAESQRIEAETLRVERDYKREAEISTLNNATFIDIQNLVKNGNFSKGTENWLTNYATLINLDGMVKLSNDGVSRTMRFVQKLNIKSNDIYYFSFKYSEASQNYKIGLRYMSNSQKDSGVVGTYSAAGNFTTDIASFQIEFIGAIPTGSILVTNVIALNLTERFGAGNEPSKQAIDLIIKENSYFEELTLRRDDIQQYEINQLRKAVIALGGTI